MLRSRRHRGLYAALAAGVLVLAAPSAGAQQRDSGRDIAAACTSCHGSDGHSRGAIASLAGRDAKSIALAVQDFREGRRPSTLMQQLARGYTDAQIEAAAAYFAAQKRDP
jgi:cytochrome subunit of sulfide dehydrogenase